jgi:hypothetical protein
VFKTLIHRKRPQALLSDKKIEMWENTLNHDCGNHSKCHHPLSGSTHANESFHAVKGKCTDKRLNFTTLTEARFALGVISQSRNPGWQDAQHESLAIPSLPAECSKILRDLNSRRQRKSEKMREEPGRRKKNETRNES